MNKKETVILILILLLAIGLRIYKLDSIPSGFHQDEVVNAYIGKFIFINGADLYGNKVPMLYFDKWGDYPPVLPMYFNGLGSLIFGNTVFGARIPTALFGVLTVLIIFFLAWKIFKNKSTALFSALTLAINPWHISFSRVGAEGVIAVFFYSLALLFFSFYYRNKNIFKGIIFTLLFFLTYLLYPGFRIIIPLTFVGLFVFNYIESKKISNGLIFNLLISIILTFIISRTQWGQGRFNQTSIISHIYNQKEYFNSFIYNENSVFIARLFNNKPIYIFQEFLRQFFSYFSAVFLFVEGGKPNWFSFPNSGLFYLSNLFLITIPLIYFSQINKFKFSKNWFGLIIYLLLAAVVPASLTNEHSPNMHRSFLMVIFMILIVSAGFQVFKNLHFKKPFFALVLGMVILGEFVYFTHNYFQHVSKYTTIARSDGNQQAAFYLKNEHTKYNKVYMFASGWFPIYYLYFSGNYSSDLIGKIQRGMRIDQFENIVFVNKDCQYSNNTFDDFIEKKGENLILFSSTCTPPVDRRLVKIDEIINSVHIPIYLVFKTSSE